MSEFKLDTREEGDVVVITTEGYLNNVGGEKIAEACYEKIDGGKNKFLLNLERSSVVNSIGVSILIEIIAFTSEWKFISALKIPILFSSSFNIICDGLTSALTFSLIKLVISFGFID